MASGEVWAPAEYTAGPAHFDDCVMDCYQLSSGETLWCQPHSFKCPNLLYIPGVLKLWIPTVSCSLAAKQLQSPTDHNL